MSLAPVPSLARTKSWLKSVPVEWEKCIAPQTHASAARIAIKVLPTGVASDPDRGQRFEREARMISRLNHPNICTLYDIGDHQGQPFIVMEVIKGETLRQCLTRGPFKIDEILELGIQLADALDAAHAEGVIHRDIKPLNIFVTDRGQAKVVDFGVAKLAPQRRSGTDTGDKFKAATTQREQLTSPGIALGTVGYMSPEQARGEELDSRTDLFSLGAVLYEMVTSHRAFPGQTSAVIFDAILNRTPVAPGRLNPAVPPKLQEIIHNALEKDRDLRYQNASDLRADLKRAKRGTDSRWSPDVSAASSSAETLSPGASGPVAASPDDRRSKLGTSPRLRKCPQRLPQPEEWCARRTRGFRFRQPDVRPSMWRSPSHSGP